MYTKITEVITPSSNYVFYLKGNTIYIGIRHKGYKTYFTKYSRPVTCASEVWYVIGLWCSDVNVTPLFKK